MVKKMKILIINPNTSDEMTQGIDKTAKQYARPDTKILSISNKKGPASIESNYETALALEGVLSEVIRANNKEYDAVILACYGDPGLEAAREISEIPVYGIGETSMHFAALLGRKFSVITDLTREIPWVERDVIRFGLEAKFASARAPGIAVLELQSNFDATLQGLIKESKKAIEEDGAEVICLGCAGMAGYDKAVEEETGVPVLDGVVCAVKFAEAMFDYKKNVSKIHSYKKPESKPLKGFLEHLEVK
jgi:allantoin racemase